MIGKKQNPSREDEHSSSPSSADPSSEDRQATGRVWIDSPFPVGLMPDDHKPNGAKTSDVSAEQQEPTLSLDFTIANRPQSVALGSIERRLDELTAEINSVASTLKRIAQQQEPISSTNASRRSKQQISPDPLISEAKSYAEALIENAQKRAHEITESALKERGRILLDAQGSAQPIPAIKQEELTNRPQRPSADIALTEQSPTRLPDRQRITLAMQVAAAQTIANDEPKESPNLPPPISSMALATKQPSVSSQEVLPNSSRLKPQFAELPITSPSKQEIADEAVTVGDSVAGSDRPAAEPESPGKAAPEGTSIGTAQGKKVVPPAELKPTFQFATIPMTLPFGKRSLRSKNTRMGPKILLMATSVFLGLFVMNSQEVKIFASKHLNLSYSAPQSAKVLRAKKPNGTQSVVEPPKKKNVGAAESIKQTAVGAPKTSAKYSPRQSSSFKPSYTDNVLFTGRYTATEWDTGYRNSWNRNLRNFLLQDMKLKPHQAGEFQTLEAKLIADLKKIGSGLQLPNKDQGILQMRSLEASAQKTFTRLLGGKANYDRFYHFKAQHFLKHQPKSW